MVLYIYIYIYIIITSILKPLSTWSRQEAWIRFSLDIRIFSSQSLQYEGIKKLICYQNFVTICFSEFKGNIPHVILLSRRNPSLILSNYKPAHRGLNVSTFLWIIAWTKHVCMPHPTLLANIIPCFQQNKDDMCDRGYFQNQCLQLHFCVLHFITSILHLIWCMT